MSWMARLHDTYEQAMERDTSNDADKPMPVSHTLQNAHINIVIDGKGNFLSAEPLEKTQIVLPATESSAGRSSGEAAHPLADKIQYVAGDYAQFGGLKGAYFDSYQAQLQEWVDSEYTHPSLQAVLAYINKKSVVTDLVSHKILWQKAGMLLTSWDDTSIDMPPLFRILPKEKGRLDQGSALVCWTVEAPTIDYAKTWMDPGIQDSWIAFYAERSQLKALCYVSGKHEAIALNHPAKLRHSGDKAKLISSNDMSGYTFRGKFTDNQNSVKQQGLQAANISSITSQKAHNALRWLISRQSQRNGDQVIVAWALSGKETLQPFSELKDRDEDYWDDYGDMAITTVSDAVTGSEKHVIDQGRDLGLAYAEKLKNYMRGYREELAVDDTIIVMVIDSATPGRMGVAYYRESMPVDYLNDITAWHSDFAWLQRAKKDITRAKGQSKSITTWRIQAPSPYHILNAVYGDILKSNKTLEKQLYLRLLPCVLERATIPEDIYRRAFYQACKASNKEHWEWERNLGVACALYKGRSMRAKDKSIKRELTMSLDTTITSRDYLYGRLLAIADNIEDFALYKAGEKRMTNAARFMQRFADRPFSTWRTIELALQPYVQRLGGTYKTQEMDEVLAQFKHDEFISDDKLSGEFLLGFHCQRMALRYKNNDTATTDTDES